MNGVFFFIYHFQEENDDKRENVPKHGASSIIWRQDFGNWNLLAFDPTMFSKNLRRTSPGEQIGNCFLLQFSVFNNISNMLFFRLQRAVRREILSVLFASGPGVNN